MYTSALQNNIKDYKFTTGKSEEIQRSIKMLQDPYRTFQIEKLHYNIKTVKPKCISRGTINAHSVKSFRFKKTSRLPALLIKWKIVPEVQCTDLNSPPPPKKKNLVAKIVCFQMLEFQTSAEVLKPVQIFQ